MVGDAARGSSCRQQPTASVRKLTWWIELELVHKIGQHRFANHEREAWMFFSKFQNAAPFCFPVQHFERLR